MSYWMCECDILLFMQVSKCVNLTVSYVCYWCESDYLFAGFQCEGSQLLFKPDVMLFVQACECVIVMFLRLYEQLDVFSVYLSFCCCFFFNRQRCYSDVWTLTLMFI